MLLGEKVMLRAREEGDVAVLDAELHADVAMHARASGNAWYPVTPGSSDSPYRIRTDETRESRAAVFSAVELASGELAGDAILWGIDLHNRYAHIGLTLRPAFRGKGLGTDIVRLLCRYAFDVRGLNRVQIETLADNDAMIAAAKHAGFTAEGTLRKTSWVNGEFADDAVFGLLAEEWRNGNASGSA